MREAHYTSNTMELLEEIKKKLEKNFDIKIEGYYYYWDTSKHVLKLEFDYM